jgi:hypothetical protein
MTKKIGIEEFQKLVKEWIRIDDKIRETNQLVKDMKIERKQIEEFVLKFIEDTDKDMTINLSKGYMKRSVEHRKGPINKNLIYTTLMDIIKDEKKVEDMTESILNKREVKEIINLKRIIPKQKNNN